MLFTLHSIEAVYTLFIPIAGRAGGNSYPDVFIAMLTAFTVLICMQYLVSTCKTIVVNTTCILYIDRDIKYKKMWYEWQ